MNSKNLIDAQTSQCSDVYLWGDQRVEGLKGKLHYFAIDPTHYFYLQALPHDAYVLKRVFRTILRKVNTLQTLCFMPAF